MSTWRLDRGRSGKAIAYVRGSKADAIAAAKRLAARYGSVAVLPNPTRTPRPGEIWRGIKGDRCRILKVEGNRVTVLQLDTGHRVASDLADFLATYKPPATPRVNAGRKRGLSSARTKLARAGTSAAAGRSRSRSNLRGGPRIVYNKLLGGWYVVVGPHQTPLNGRFNSKAEAQAWLYGRRSNPSRSKGARAIRASVRARTSRKERRSRSHSQAIYHIQRARTRGGSGGPRPVVRSRSNPRGHDPYLDEAVSRIRTALRRRSGRSWTVKRGRGSTYGWIYITTPSGSLTPAEQHQLAALLGISTVHHQGVMIPSGSNERAEYVARAEGGPKQNRRRMAHHASVAQVFGKPWESLSLNEVTAVLKDIAELADELAGEYDEGDDIAAAGELRRRIGGAGNIKSYAQSLVAGGGHLNPSRSKKARARRSTYRRAIGGSRRIRRAVAAYRASGGGYHGSRERVKYLYRQRESVKRRKISPLGFMAGYQRKTSNPRGLEKTYRTEKSFRAALARFTASGELVDWFATDHGWVIRLRKVMRRPNPKGRKPVEGSGVRWVPSLSPLAQRKGLIQEAVLSTPVGAVLKQKAIQDRARVLLDAWLRGVLQGQNTVSLEEVKHVWLSSLMVAARELGPKPNRRSNRPKKLPRRVGRGTRAVGARGSRLTARRRMVRGKGRSNPRSQDLARARRTFRRLNEIEPGKLTTVKGASNAPKVAVKLGELVSFRYLSDKYAGSPDNPKGKTLLYEHTTRRPRPVLATDPGGKEVHIVGGRMHPTPDGLVN